MQRQNGLKFSALIAISTLLTALTVVLGAIPMRVIYRAWGRSIYWLSFMALAGALVLAGEMAIAAVVAILAFLIGFYSEAEHQGSSLFGAASVSVLATVGLVSGGTAVWGHFHQVNLLATAKEISKTVVERALAINPHLEISSDLLAYQVPSFIVVALVLSLAAALIWEKRTEELFRMTLPEQALRLREFKVPGFFVWAVILASVGAFVEHGRPLFETFSLNALNVLAAIYFFQGIAVISHFFRFYKISPFWQVFWFLVLFVQLFPLVSFIGFTDFWLEYRTRLRRKATEVNKRII
jgi:hypothetical protein